MKVAKVIVCSMVLSFFLLSSCQDATEEKEGDEFTGAPNEVELITLAPGHFHAHLVQKSMYEQVSPLVHVYAPEGPEVEEQIARIESYNTREDDPTDWELVVYKGDDYLERMLEEKKGNVVVLAGKNRNKTKYIHASVSNGLNVLSDKPMAIDSENFELLKEAFSIAENNDVLLYDIMTERYESTSAMLRELKKMPGIFGELVSGSVEEPAVVQQSVHHLFKYVAGSILRRPPWYFDVNQQGEGIVDVMTHLVDLVQWTSFPDQIIDYETDIEMIDARRWPTKVTRQQYENITRLPDFPDYLSGNVKEGVLDLYANGEIHYKLNGVHVKVRVQWDYEAPEGGGDLHYSLSRGTRANLMIRQSEEENFDRVLYIKPLVEDLKAYEETLHEEFKQVEAIYPGAALEKTDEKTWRVNIPEKYDMGHEGNFSRVTAKYLQFLVDGKLPEWEVPNMISKYYTNIKGLEIAKSKE